MSKEYILYCDESLRSGEFYSNFYGGALVKSKDLEKSITLLEAKKLSLNLRQELKWEKITENYQSKYIEFMRCFFSLLRDRKIKVRIMFRQSCHVPKGLDSYQLENEYFLLYYQFIKHAFGLRYSNDPPQFPINIRLYFDTFPDTRERYTNLSTKKFGKYFLTST